MVFEKNVFINCPFDKNFIDDLLKPMIYVVVRNGFNPRTSLEVSDSGQLRIEKITNIIKDCKFSIHDLSKVKSSEPNEYSRMNMPFELGIDYGLRNSGIEHFSTKRFLILEEKKYEYMKAISDFNGFDIKAHNNTSQGVIDCLYAWFSETINIHNQPPPLKLFYDYVDLISDLFEDKLNKFKLENIALDYMNKISIPEFIREIQSRL